MPRHDEGRPGAALLLLCSMFLFAWVFHAVTKPDAVLQARFDTQVAPLAHAIAAAAPDLPALVTVTVSAQIQPARAVTAAMSGASIDAPAVDIASAPPLGALAWPLSPVPAPGVAAVSPAIDLSDDRGAVSRAFTTTATALRGAFRKTF